MSENKKRFQMPSSYTVLIIIITIMAFLTWIIPAGKYDTNEAGNLIAGTYQTVDSNPQGIYDVLMAPIRAMLGHEPTSAAIDVAFFILMVGGFLGVVNATGTLDVGIASIVKKYKGREKMLILILMPLFSLGGTTYGMGEETMAFYPLLIPVMMAVGFDSITAVAIILLGSQVGCLASTLNPFATVIASDTAGISSMDGVILRVIFWFVMTGISTYFVYRYAEKIQKDPTKSLVYAQREEDIKHFNVSDNEEAPSTLSKKQKHVLALFVLTFIIMIASFIPWVDLHVTVFEDFKNWLIGLPVIGGVIGSSALPFGSWYFPEGAMLFAVMGILIGVVYGLKESKIVSTFLTGAADLLSVALICAVARGIQVIMNDGMITATILHWGEVGLQGLSPQIFIVLTYIFYLPMSFLIPSSSGLASATMGIMAPLGEFVNVKASLIVTAYQSASGVLNLVTPTSGIVMGALALGRVSLGTWWKFVGKLVIVIVVASILLLILGTFVPFL